MTEEQMQKRIKGKLSPRVLEKFPLSPDGRRRNPRLEGVRGLQENYSRRRAASGSAGGKARWQTHVSKPNPDIEKHSSPSPTPTPTPVQESYHANTRTVLHLLNQESGKSFRELDGNLKFISARLSEPGVDLDGIKLMLVRQWKRWKGTDQAEYFRPETLFNKTKFDGYYAARLQPIEASGTNRANHKPGIDRNAGNLNSLRTGQYDSVGKVPEVRPP